MKNETKYTDDDIAGMRLQAMKRKRRRRMGVQYPCPDCGRPTENEGYCDNCELRHIQFNGRI